MMLGDGISNRKNAKVAVSHNHTPSGCSFHHRLGQLLFTDRLQTWAPMPVAELSPFADHGKLPISQCPSAPRRIDWGLAESPPATLVRAPNADYFRPAVAKEPAAPAAAPCAYSIPPAFGHRLSPPPLPSFVHRPGRSLRCSVRSFRPALVYSPPANDPIARPPLDAPLPAASHARSAVAAASSPLPPEGYRSESASAYLATPATAPRALLRQTTAIRTAHPP